MLELHLRLHYNRGLGLGLRSDSNDVASEISTPRLGTHATRQHNSCVFTVSVVLPIRAFLASPSSRPTRSEMSVPASRIGSCSCMTLLCSSLPGTCYHGFAWCQIPTLLSDVEHAGHVAT